MYKKRKLGRGVAMVGAGMSKFDMFSDKDSKDLFAEAFVEMNTSVDKGLDPADIDALYLGNFTNDFSSTNLIGGQFFPILSDSFPNRQREPKAPVLQAHLLSAKAFCNSIRILRCSLGWRREDMSKRSTEEVAEGLALAASPYERKAGLTFPGVFAVIATAYFEKYGASREHLMNVTIKSHDNAALNPKSPIQPRHSRHDGRQG